MRARHYAFTPAAASATSIASTQSAAGAGSLLLDGTYGPNGFGYLVEPTKTQLRPAWQITVTAAGNVSTRTFTVTYLDANGVQRTGTVTGVNTNTVNSTFYAMQVLSVTVDGAAANVSVGHIVVGYAPWKNLPFRRGYPGCTVSVGVTTANYTVEISYADIADNDTFLGTFDFFNHPSLNAKSISGYAEMENRVAAFRLKINSWSAGEIRMDLAVPMAG